MLERFAQGWRDFWWTMAEPLGAMAGIMTLIVLAGGLIAAVVFHEEILKFMRRDRQTRGKASS